MAKSGLNCPLPVGTKRSAEKKTRSSSDYSSESSTGGHNSDSDSHEWPTGSSRSAGKTDTKNEEWNVKIKYQSENHDKDENELAWVEQAARKVPCLGILFAMLASLFLGSANMLVKLISSVHGIQVALFRALIQLVIYSCLIAMRTRSVRPARGEILPVFGRAALGACSITSTYYALHLIPLADATTIRFSLPIWSLVISYFVLGESCNLLKISAVFVAVLGVVMIAKPEAFSHLFGLVMSSLNLYQRDEAEEDSLSSYPEEEEPQSKDWPHQLEGSLLALCSSICLSLSLVAMRLCRNTPSEITVFWLSLLSAATSLVTLLAIGKLQTPDNALDLVYIALNGLLGSLGQWFITNALKVEQSSVIALVRTSDIEIAFMYSALLLGEQIRPTSLLGAVLVSSGVLLVLVPKWIRSRRPPDTNKNSVGDQASEEKCPRQLESGLALPKCSPRPSSTGIH